MTESNPGQERRNYPRIDGKSCRIDYKPLPQENKTVYSFIQVSTAENIGGGGISFVTREAFVLQSFLQMKITLLKDSKVIDAIGRVIRCNEIKPGYYQTACFFVSINKDDHMFLIDSLKSVIKDL